MVAYTVLAERRVLGFIQGRLGPNRVGPGGFLQPLADLIKFIFKEDIVPDKSTRFVYFLAPVIATVAALMSIIVYPFGPDIHIPFIDKTIPLVIARFDVALLYVLGVTSVGVYGIALAGWSSNSKYPLLGGLRSSAQMISYELTLTMSVVGVLLMAGSFNLRDIINAQARHPEWGILGWNLWPQILGFFCFFTAAVAETNRVPFDLPEAESELVAGFHTEYASFKFAMFFIAEYTSMITVSCLCTIMFFGGWLSPFPASWTVTQYLPSVILIPFGLWVILDGLRYETVFGRLVLPAIGTAITTVGLILIVDPRHINEFIQAPFWFLSKVLVFLFIYVWMRGTLPRFRYDQLMAFGWKFLLPLAIANLVVTALVVAVKP